MKKKINKKNILKIFIIFKKIFKYNKLIFEITKHEINKRYKGSIIGTIWLFLNPICMLFIYTFIFSVIFKYRWSVKYYENHIQFSLMIFTGMIIHNFFSETINKSPNILLNNINFIKKIVFPLEVLSIINILEILFHSIISLLILIIAFFIFNNYLNWTIIFIPIIMFPLVILCLGLSWILSSLGVFIRDINYITNIISSIMMFLSPIFFPINSLPSKYKNIILFNPLTIIIDQMRSILILGNLPKLKILIIYTFISIFIGYVGYMFFKKTKIGFADVL